MNNQAFAKTILLILLIVGAVLFLYSVIKIGDISLDADNMIAQKDADGEPMLDDEGQPIMEAAGRPDVPAELATLVALVGSALAVNFGGVVGFEVTRSARGLGFWGKARGVLAALWNNIRNLRPRHWAVLLYLVGLGLGLYFFIADKGFDGQAESVAEPLADMWQTILGVVVGAFANLEQE